MFEKCNPAHPDKIADRIAGAIVDLAYSKKENPKVACEVLIGHNTCRIINETDTHITEKEVNDIVKRITFNPHLKKQLSIIVDYLEVKQDAELARNQSVDIKCGDNGIFKGCPITCEQTTLTKIALSIYNCCKSDGKYIYDTYNAVFPQLIMCQSYLDNKTNLLIKNILDNYGVKCIINPLGDWTGGINVDTGATNRKLGSDMGDAVTGGGLHGKDLSKADVSVNIYCHWLAEVRGYKIEAKCAIGDKSVVIRVYDSVGNTIEVNNVDYIEIVKQARKYIQSIGGFEKLAEWGLIR